VNCRSSVESTQMTSKPPLDVTPGLAWRVPVYWPCGVRHLLSLRVGMSVQPEIDVTRTQSEHVAQAGSASVDSAGRESQGQ
jgi:hypothetical protein